MGRRSPGSGSVGHLLRAAPEAVQSPDPCNKLTLARVALVADKDADSRRVRCNLWADGKNSLTSTKEKVSKAKQMITTWLQRKLGHGVDQIGILVPFSKFELCGHGK